MQATLDALIALGILGGMGVVFGSPIGAILLRAGAKWVAGLDVGFWNAALAWLIAYVISLLLSLVAGISLRIVMIGTTIPARTALLVQIGVWVVSILVQACVVSWRFRVGYGRALLMCLVALGLLVGILAGFTLVFLGLDAVLGG